MTIPTDSLKGHQRSQVRKPTGYVPLHVATRVIDGTTKAGRAVNNKSFGDISFDGKRVAVVGSGESLLNRRLGSVIDSFDIVLRFREAELHVEEFSKYCGTRTDIVVQNSEPAAAGRFLRGLEAGQYRALQGVLFPNSPLHRSPTLTGRTDVSGLKLSARALAREKLYMELMAQDIPFKVVNARLAVFKHKAARNRRFSPSAGCGIVFYLCSQKCKSIGLCGFDRLHGHMGFNHYYPVATEFYNHSLRRHHRLDQEAAHIKRLMELDRRVRLL